MEANKIKGKAQGLTLDNGAELTYCELGQDHQEILVTTAFYFHTFMPVVEELAKRFHVYALIMRFDGPTDQLNADGTTNWARQWGKDLYDFCVKKGLKKFIHFGKCHGTIPGWYLVKEHPEMLDCFASFYLLPHVKGQTSNTWFDGLNPGIEHMMGMAMRKQKTGIPKKIAEVRSIGDAANKPEFQKYAPSPELIWDSLEDCDKALKNMTVPVGYCFGTQDPVFQDYYESNIYGIMNTRGSRTIFLEGEKHLMELDNPERVAAEVFDFVDQCHKGYYKEITEPTGDEDPGFLLKTMMKAAAKLKGVKA